MRKCETEAKKPREREGQGLRSPRGSEAMMSNVQGGSFFLPDWEKSAGMDADVDKFNGEADTTRN